MFGGAIRETPELMPLAIVLAREILVKLTKLTALKRLHGQDQICEITSNISI